MAPPIYCDTRVLLGGKLQQTAAVAVHVSDVCMIDEPSWLFLDVKQQLTATGVIRDILQHADNDRQ